MRTQPLPKAEQRSAGRELRQRAPRRDLAEVGQPAGRDAVGLVRSQNENRIAELVPIRMQRMTESPFAFYRGAALVMAADLAAQPAVGPLVQVCGDAHVANFGVFGSGDGRLIFDVNDFDETFVASWDTDVKRLVASVVIAAQHVNLEEFDQQAAALAAARSYRLTMAKLAQLSAVDRFYLNISAHDVLSVVKRHDKRAGKSTKKKLAKARANTSSRALTKLGVQGADGNWTIADHPPLIDRLPDEQLQAARSLTNAYVRSVPADVAALLGQLTFADAVVKVVGVGSVGTRCFLVLLTDPDGAPLFLQIKEAGRSALDRSRAKAAIATAGRRVVTGQRIMQSSTDPFLGWFRVRDGSDLALMGSGSYYVRQFRNMKGSLNLETVDAKALIGYGELCAAVLARAHAQSGSAATIAGYLGSTTKTNVADTSLADFGQAYAEINRADFEALVAATRGAD